LRECAANLIADPRAEGRLRAALLMLRRDPEERRHVTPMLLIRHGADAFIRSQMMSPVRELCAQCRAIIACYAIKSGAASTPRRAIRRYICTIAPFTAPEVPVFTLRSATAAHYVAAMAQARSAYAEGRGDRVRGAADAQPRAGKCANMQQNAARTAAQRRGKV